MCYDCLSRGKIKFSRVSKSAFEEKDPWALHMTSSTANTLKIRLNSLRVSEKKSKKRSIWVETAEERASSLFFTK